MLSVAGKLLQWTLLGCFVTQHPESVVECDHNNPAESGENSGIVEVRGAPGPGVAVNDDKDSKL